MMIREILRPGRNVALDVRHTQCAHAGLPDVAQYAPGTIWQCDECGAYFLVRDMPGCCRLYWAGPQTCDLDELLAYSDELVDAKRWIALWAGAA